MFCMSKDFLVVSAVLCGKTRRCPFRQALPDFPSRFALSLAIIYYVRARNAFSTPFRRLWPSGAPQAKNSKNLAVCEHNAWYKSRKRGFFGKIPWNNCEVAKLAVPLQRQNERGACEDPRKVSQARRRQTAFLGNSRSVRQRYMTQARWLFLGINKY